MSDEPNFDAWELRALDRFATKSHLREVEGKVETIALTTTEQGKMLSKLDATMTAVLRVLVRIAWIVATPLLGAIGTGFIWLIYQMVNNGFL